MSSLGNFASLQAAWEAYPEGANKGDYIFIPDTDGVRYNWDKHKRNWIAEGQPSSGTRFTEHVPGNIEVDFDAKINGSLEVSNFDEGNVAEKAILSSVEERVTTEEGKTATLQEDVAVLQEKTIRNKGVFATYADLPNANLVAGDFAYVGTDLAALELYNYTTSWVDSGTTFNVLSLDLVDSVTGDAVDKAPTQHAVNAALPAQSFAAAVLTNPFTAGKAPRRIGDVAINTTSGEIWQSTAITNAAASWNCISAGYYNGRIITNWDTHTQSGDITSYDTATGAPTSTESFYGHHINSNAGTANAVQWAIGYTTLKMYFRAKTASTWGAWSTGITAAELGYLSGVTSNIQAQLIAVTDEQIQGGIYDVSSHNDGAVFESISALLGSANLSTLIPTSVRRGGMSIRFIQGSVPNSDNKYVQYRLMSDTFNTIVANWQGVDAMLTAGSQNLVTSGGVVNYINATGLVDVLSESSPTIIQQNYAITASGEIGSDSSMSHCAPFQVSKGDIIKASARLDSVSAAAIAITDSTQSFYICVVTGSATGEVTERTYTATQDCWITCSYRTDKGLSVTVVSNTKGLVTQNTEAIEQNTEDITTNTQVISHLSEEYNKIIHGDVEVEATFTSSSRTLNLSGLYDSNNTQKVDWGDGTPLVSVSSSADLSHTYQSGIGNVFIAKVWGVTSLGSSAIYDKDAVTQIWFYGKITSLASQAVYLNKNLKEVYFLNEELIPTFASNALLIAGAYKIKTIVVADNMFSKWLTEVGFWNSNSSVFTQLTNTSRTLYRNHEIVTVGSTGDFESLKKAVDYFSTKNPHFIDYGQTTQPCNYIIKILSNTVISEQIKISAIDLSHIGIVYEDYSPESLSYDSVAEDIANGTIVFGTTEGYNAVSVNASSFTGSTHDTRGDVCLFQAENGAVLPTIGCVFKLTTPATEQGVAGIVCNKSSKAVVEPLCGFIGFNDGVIANNESSITIREGITLNCARWGCHARHNGEVSARSIIATGCATLQDSTEYGAAVADRVANLDVREAYLSGNVAIRCSNASSVCARAAHILGGGVAGTYLVLAENCGRINASEMEFLGVSGDGYKVQYGGFIDAFSPTGSPTFSQTKNEISSNGIIFG